MKKTGIIAFVMFWSIVLIAVVAFWNVRPAHAAACMNPASVHADVAAKVPDAVWHALTPVEAAAVLRDYNAEEPVSHVEASSIGYFRIPGDSIAFLLIVDKRGCVAVAAPVAWDAIRKSLGRPI